MSFSLSTTHYSFFIVFFILCTAAKPQEEDDPLLLFASEDLLEMRLEADLETFLGDRGGDADYHDAQVSYTHEGKEYEAKVDIKVRGRFRRDELICRWPPIRMKVKKKEKSPLLKGQRKIKLVTQCQEQAAVLKEYYLYKTFAMLSPQHFRVRLVKVEYVDTKGVFQTETQYGFFIESEKELGNRLGYEPLDEDIQVRSEEVNRDQMTLIHIFNYMIANRDFDVLVRQNVKVFSTPDDLPIVIPYDFDWAGIVNASYTLTRSAKAHPYKKRQRFKKLCRTDAEFQAAIAQFQKIREPLFEMYKNSPYLDKKSVKETLKYFKLFYRNIGNDKTVQEVFIASCNR
ncbi:MAG: hypothetical protein AAF206_10765 [Bacteroidota bacterium]